jgi:hypothetical protein
MINRLTADQSGLNEERAQVKPWNAELTLKDGNILKTWATRNAIYWYLHIHSTSTDIYNSGYMYLTAGY